MSFLRHNFKGYSARHADFAELLIEFSKPVDVLECLPTFCNRSNFRQIGDNREAVSVDLVPYKYGFTLRDFNAVTTGQGYGGAVMELITDIADATGMRIDLRAVPKHVLSENRKLVPVVSQARLVRFYERNNFFLVPETQSLAPRMIRIPKLQR